MTGSRNLLWLLPLILLATSPLWWPSLSAFLQPRGDFTTPLDSRLHQNKSFSMQAVRLIQNKGNRKDMVLNASEVMTTPEDQNRMEMKDITATLFDDKNRPINIVSGEAEYDIKRQELLLQNDVVLTSPDGYELKTQVLRYFTKEREVKTAEAVSLAGSNLDLKGKGMFLDLDSNAFRIGGRVYFRTW